MGSLLPKGYVSTSIDLTDSYSLEQTLERLNMFQALRNIPKCWAVIQVSLNLFKIKTKFVFLFLFQPFICSVFLPKCEKINNKEMVYLPSLEMCKFALEPCRILFNTSYFPEFLKCDPNQYPTQCSNDVREMKFNGTGQCLKPLVPVESTTNYYKGIDGCGLQCKDPLYTDDEHSQIHNLIGWLGSICLACNLFCVATFMVDRKNSNKFPAKAIFYMNLCYTVHCIGWLAQFFPGARDDIVCRKDGTLRHSEPNGGENLSCPIIFTTLYYSAISTMVWFSIFTYTWWQSVHHKEIGKIQDRIDKYGDYVHIIAWSIPAILTVAVWAFSEIDGISIVGICFVGSLDHWFRSAFLLLPLALDLSSSVCFIALGMWSCFKLKKTSQKAAKEIRKIIIRLCLRFLFQFVSILASFFCHYNDFKNSDKWNETLRNFIICNITSKYSDGPKCLMESRPSVAVLQLHLFCVFGSGVIMSSWVLTDSTIDTWKRFIQRCRKIEVVEPIKLQKHKLIAQAYEKRQDFQQEGRLSLTFTNSHKDPVGLNFDINSVESNDFSTTWANQLPRFVCRRDALTGATSSSSRKNSMNSEISISVCHLSVESRRNSVDSQVSVKYAEMKTKVGRSGRGSKGHSKTKSHRRREFSAASTTQRRRESSTSVESQIITALQKTKYSNKNILPYNKNMKRRSANAGLSSDQINSLLSNGKLLLPFLQNQGLTTSDEDVNVVQDVILKQIHHSRMNRKESFNSDDDDLEEDDNHQQTHHKIKIEEYNSDNEETNSPKKKTYPSIQDILNDRPNDENNLIVRSSKDGGRISKNSAKSSRKSLTTNRQSSSRRSRNNSRSITKNRKEKEKEKHNFSDFDDSSFTSYCSELSEIAIQSSYSGVSIGGGRNNKNNSRSSKRSCDVGIQANANEIATQTMSSYVINENDKNNKKTDDDFTENCQLLPTHLNRRSTISRNQQSMSESERLKLLLLPSK